MNRNFNKAPQNDSQAKGIFDDPNAWWKNKAEMNKEVYPYVDLSDKEGIRKGVNHEDFWNKEFVDFIRAEMTKARSSGKVDSGVHRGFHGKGQACLKGELTPNPSRKREYRVGAFATDKTYKIWSRFSNGLGGVGPDNVVQPRGFAIKLLGVEGKQLLPQRQGATTQDFLGVNSPAFPTRNLKDFVNLSKAQANPSTLPGFLLGHPHVAEILLKHLEQDVGSLLTIKYWSGGSIMWGGKAAKYFFAPCSEPRAKQPKDAKPEYLTDDLRARMNSGEACFNFFVQLQADVFKTPVEDPSIVWDEKLAVPELVGTFRFPKQNFESNERKLLCEDMLFNVWQGVVDHQPIGNIMRSRKIGYEASSAHRHTANGRPLREPTGMEP
jgi:hypothetical protein